LPTTWPRGGRGDEAVEIVEARRPGLPVAGRTNTIGAWNMLLGFVEALARAAIAAVAARDWDAAERHLATAQATAEALGNRIEPVDLGLWRARMLGDRDGPGDREAAAALAAEVAGRYRELGLPRHAELAATLLGPDTAT
jgi:hypothetical protein